MGGTSACHNSHEFIISSRAFLDLPKNHHRVVAIPATAPLGVAFGGDAVAACAAGGEIEKEESLVAPLFAGLPGR